MVSTTAGLQIARLTIINSKAIVIFDQFLKPLGEVLDYNLRFSGVTPADLQKAKYNLKELKAKELGKYINETTIIIGHGLENDLKALRIIHPTIIDTAILFPHPRGKPWRNSLKILARDILGRFIQDFNGSGSSGEGHSSLEDSIAALELVRWKVVNEK